MNPIAIKVISILLTFFLGYGLKKANIFRSSDADVMLRFIFYVALPAIILTSVSQIVLTRELLFLPLITIGIILITWLITTSLSKTVTLPRTTLGTFIIAPMTLNTSFALPFVEAFYGSEGVSRLALFDLGHVLLVFTLTYYLACLYGGKELDKKLIFKKVCLAPPLWALAIALILNVTQNQIPEMMSPLLSLLSNTASPLILIAMGIYFTPNITNKLPVMMGVFARIGCGFLLGYGAVLLLGLTGITKTVVLLCAATSVGFNTLLFASIEKLDKEFAASIVSLSLIISLLVFSLIVMV